MLAARCRRLNVLAKLFLAVAAAFLALLAAYVVWHHAQFLTGVGRAALFFGAPALGCIVCLAALRLPPAARTMAALLVVSAACAVYGFEGYLLARAMIARAPIAATAGADNRTKYEVTRDLRAKGRAAYPAVFPAYLMQTGLDGTLHSPLTLDGRELLPLGGVARVETVLCNEPGFYVTYMSDRYGFNNPDATWDAPVGIAAVGDSFTQGVCVKPGENYAALLHALNVGSSGAGPLIELAALREYLPAMKPRIVLWFFFEGNDLPGDFAIETKSPLLRGYLDGRTQGLPGRAAGADAALRAYVDALIAAGPERIETSAGPIQTAISFIGLAQTRAALALPAALGPADYLLFERVLGEAKKSAAGWGGRLYVVYIPSFCAVVGDKCAPVLGEVRSHVIETSRTLDLPVIDLLQALQRADDPRGLFTRRDGGHFGPRGNRIVAEAVRARLAQDGD